MDEDKPHFFKAQCKRDGLLVLVARLILGAVFIYASMDKIAHPEAFAEVVHNYQILPDALVNLTAIVLPWLELVTGAFLVIGLFREGTVSIVTLLLTIFFGAVIFNLARGLDIHCGCFHTSTQLTDSTSMSWYVFRDSLFLLTALYLFFRTFRGRRQKAGM
ncbi:MAG: DoxX family membrane protein [Deltaproteobacteria bacterium]|nr:DoxX family membrane protein [Deltaproteobacteria bacterium]